MKSPNLFIKKKCGEKTPQSVETQCTPSPRDMSVQSGQITGAGLSLSESRCKIPLYRLRHPDQELGRLRMILHLDIAWGVYFFRVSRGESLPAKRAFAVAYPPRRSKRCNPSLSLPPDAEAHSVPLRVWAGF